METTRAHVRAIGNGAVVEVTFATVSVKPRIVQIAAACDRQFNVTRATSQRAASLRKHHGAWVQHARDIGHGTGAGVLWLLTPQPGADGAVSVRELVIVLQQCVAQLSHIQVAVLMHASHREAFVQHWSAADSDAVPWHRFHIFTNATGLHAFVAARGDRIKHVCAVSGTVSDAVRDMYVSEDAVLHAVVDDGSFVYNVPAEWPVAMVHRGMPMLAAEHGTATMQTRGGERGCGAIEIRQGAENRQRPVRLLYVSKFCNGGDNNGPQHPVLWLKNLLCESNDVESLQHDNLLLSLVLRAVSADTPRPLLIERRGRENPAAAVTSPHLHRSVTQQFR